VNSGTAETIFNELDETLLKNGVSHRDDPIISAVYGQLWQFLKNLLGRFVTIQAIVDSQADISSVQYKNQQLSGKCPDVLNRLK
uniref:Uncharacterized protein n=1 Tax=Amphimedon queenslandica TaxID=400682 RepID=A0A1X7T404_AMPQE